MPLNGKPTNGKDQMDESRNEKNIPESDLYGFDIERRAHEPGTPPCGHSTVCDQLRVVFEDRFGVCIRLLQFNRSLKPAASPVSRLLDLISRFCSQRRHLLGGIGGYLRAAVVIPLKNTVEEETSSKDKTSEEISPEEILTQIRQNHEPRERLQFYDPQQKELWFACGDDEKAVFVSSKKHLKKATRPFVSKLTPELVGRFQNHADPVDGNKLFNSLRKLVEEYLHFPDSVLYSFLSVYMTATYLYSVFSHFGYFFAYSKKPRCGKTRILELASHLGFESSKPINAPTPASVRELAVAGRTLQLDTLERWKNKESFSDVMDYLDAGFRNGGTATKMIPTGNDGWANQEFPVYAPYFLAGINKHSLTATALDRSFDIQMYAKSAREKKESYSYFKCEEKCKCLREDLYLWALQNAENVVDLYESNELEGEIEHMQLNDRAADIWRPIFSVLRGLGFEAGSPEWEALSNLARRMHLDPEIEEAERQLQILQALQRRSNADGNVVGITTDLLEYLQEQEITTNQKEFNQLMEEWGFAQKSIRLPGIKHPRRAWELSVEILAEIERQLTKFLSFTPEMATTVTTSADLSSQGAASADPDLNGDSEDQEES